MKENNTIQYIHTKSNHPPSVIKNIPSNINNRLSRNSVNSEVFDSSTQPYSDALKASGYEYELKFDESVKQQQMQQQSNGNKRKRSRNVTWFNPPFSLNVKSNIGKIFLNLIKECFPKNHILSKICNKNTLKLSYRTMPNMRRNISKHNNQIFQQRLQENNPQSREVPNCNCQVSRRPDCPFPGQCNVSNVVYRCHVTTPNGITETYTGCTKDFKTRCQAHLRSFENINNKQTTLSSYVWSLKHANTPYTIRWSHRARGRPYNPSTGVCRLCLLEKYFILFEQDGASLNQRDEFFGHCFHKKPQLLMSKK